MFFSEKKAAYQFSHTTCFFSCFEKLFSDAALEEGQDLLNTGLIGSSLYNENHENLEPSEVFLTFSLQNANIQTSNKSCVFWDVRLNSWSSENCFLVEETETEIKCQCNHLTNFGVIMDVNGILGDDVSSIFRYFCNL